MQSWWFLNEKNSQNISYQSSAERLVSSLWQAENAAIIIKTEEYLDKYWMGAPICICKDS